MHRHISPAVLLLLIAQGIGSLQCSRLQRRHDPAARTTPGSGQPAGIGQQPAVPESLSSRGAAGDGASALPGKVNVTATADATGLAQAATEFGFRLFRKLVAAEPGNSVFISPASIAMALTMTCNGAGGATQEAMVNVLGLQGMSREQVNQASQDLRAALVKPDSSVQLAIANSLWGKQGITFKAAFLETCRRYFAARLSVLDFASPDAASTINKWVSENTRGKVPSIVDRIGPQYVLFLINAVYFKGGWSTKFDAKLTRDRDFHPTRTATRTIPMMEQSGDYQYYQGEGFQAVRLPYGKGRVGMYILLPDSNSDLPQLYARLDGATWGNWLGRFRSMPGSIVLPRFRLDYSVDLSAVLKNLGMTPAFDPGRADFSPMIDLHPGVNAYISEVKHKTFVEVSEEGTEAAAATSVGIALTSVPREPPKRFVMVMDRPFFCAIRDDPTGALLFMGSIANPQ